MSDSTSVIEESSDQNTKQKSQVTVVEALANKVLVYTHAAETADTGGRSSCEWAVVSS